METMQSLIHISNLEFREPIFLDLSTLTIDRVSLSKEDGSKLGEGDHVVLAKGLSNALFKGCTCI